MVFGTPICTFRRKERGRLVMAKEKLLETWRTPFVVAWVLAALLGAILGWMCINLR